MNKTSEKKYTQIYTKHSLKTFMAEKYVCFQMLLVALELFVFAFLPVIVFETKYGGITTTLSSNVIEQIKWLFSSSVNFPLVNILGAFSIVYIIIIIYLISITFIMHFSKLEMAKKYKVSIFSQLAISVFMIAKSVFSYVFIQKISLAQIKQLFPQISIFSAKVTLAVDFLILIALLMTTLVSLVLYHNRNRLMKK